MKTHGLMYVNGKRRPEYNTWHLMKKRCYNKNHPFYHAYGGRGISVCDRWINSFKNFFEDMGARPNATYSLDRIDNDGNYEPSNCKWSTRAEQINNTRSNIFLEHQGIRLTLGQWGKKLGINKSTLLSRLRCGWGVDKMLTTKVRKRRIKNRSL
jgi:hypothetical protein